MGISVQELLALEYFKEFYVVAGRKGLHKEVQGVTLLEAPDATRWGKGKELILSSGYVISKEPDCIRRSFEEGSILGISAMMLKRERYLNKIPEEMIELFDRHEIPLISMPFSIPWMELMNQINTAVMNRTIRRFRIYGNHAVMPSDQSYKVQKIKRILQAVEVEMKFPAFLYDLEEGKSYYSSANFKTITASFGLSESDYWAPSRPHTKHTLCDYINMTRYRLINHDNPDSPRVSWIIMPIVMEQTVQAYFVVMESRDFIDYYDEYAIRIAFLMIQNVYEQLMVVRSVGDVGFENFILFALHSKEDAAKLAYQANIQGVSIDENYIYTVFRQKNESQSARNERKAFVEALRQSTHSGTGKLAFLGENEGLLLFESDEFEGEKSESVKKLLQKYGKCIGEKCEGMELEFGVCLEPKSLMDIVLSVAKCRKVLEMGKMLCPKEQIWFYENLGPLVWLQIPSEELKHLLEKYRSLMADEKNAELLYTLKIYLENNMNYSTTAEKMYVHINTIRKRIDKVNQLLEIDWENHVERLKIELLLQFLDFGK